MNKSFLLKISLLLIIAAFINGCKTESSSEGVDDMEFEQTENQNQAAQSGFERSMKTNYKLPSPVELYIFLREEEALFNRQILNSDENLSKYYTTKSKAINFGVYASDLAYCTVYAKPQQTFHYFKAAKTLATELGLAEGFDEMIQKRLESNLNNTDSLYNITSDSYWEATSYLEDQDKTDVLAYIILGGWIESVFIAVNSVDQYDDESEIIVRIAEQQLLIENLLENLKLAAEKNTEIAEIIEHLMDLKTSFDKLYENSNDVIITENQFNEISDKVKSLRNQLIS